MISDQIVVKRHEQLPDDIECLFIGMWHHEYRTMPDCIVFRDRMYRKSSFNTDSCECCYRTDKVCVEFLSDILRGDKTYQNVADYRTLITKRDDNNGIVR